MQLITSIVIIICVVGFFLILAIVFLVYKYRVARYYSKDQQWQLAHPHRTSGFPESKYIPDGKQADLPADRRVVLRNGKMVTAGGHRDPAVTSHWYDVRNNSWLASAISLARREDLKRYNGGQDEREPGAGVGRGRGGRDIQSAPPGQDWRPPLRSPTSTLDVEKAMEHVGRGAPTRPLSAPLEDASIPHIQAPEPTAQPPASAAKRSSRTWRSTAQAKKRASQASQTGSKRTSHAENMQPLPEHEFEQDPQQAQLSPQELDEHRQQQRQQYMEWEADQRRWEQEQRQNRRQSGKRSSRMQFNDADRPRRTSSRSKPPAGATDIRIVSPNPPELRVPAARNGKDSRATGDRRRSSRVPVPVGSYLDQPAGPQYSHMPPQDQVAAYDHYYSPQTHDSRPAHGSAPLPLLPADQDGSISGVSTGDGATTDNRLSSIIVSPLETRAPLLDPAAAAAVAAQMSTVRPLSTTEPRSPLEMGTAAVVPVVRSRGNSAIVQATAPLRTQAISTIAPDRASFLHSPSAESLPFPIGEAFPGAAYPLRTALFEHADNSSTSDSPPSEAYGVDGNGSRYSGQPGSRTSAPRASIDTRDAEDDHEENAAAGQNEKYIVDAPDMPDPDPDFVDNGAVFLAATLSKPPTLDFTPDSNQLEAAATAESRAESLTPPRDSADALPAAEPGSHPAGTPLPAEQPASTVSPVSNPSPLEQRSRNMADDEHPSQETEQPLEGQGADTTAGEQTSLEHNSQHNEG